ncbi:MAG TPA: GGDEF domain-containing protein [Woeseiaceae bacterium]|nr:GGDEF domain-containing protein [Woeseiaceae bacterium]
MSVLTHNPVQARTRVARKPGRAPLHESADAEELALALDTSRRQLKELLRQNEELLHTRSLLTEQVASLERALAKANEFAHYDELTGLPNRRLLLDRFNQASSLANRYDQGVALTFFDLNDFKSVNEKLGRDAGDRLLRQVAIRLTNAIRGSDTACRYGGDEFVVLLTEIAHRENAVRALQKIRTALGPPFVIDRYAIRLAVNNGMAVYPQDAQSFTDLMWIADRSMCRNKSGIEAERRRVPASNIWLHDAEQDLCTD